MRSFAIAIALLVELIGCRTAEGVNGVPPWSLQKSDIPSGLPSGVRRAVAKTFSADPDERARAADAIARMGYFAAPTVPFLLRLANDSESTSYSRPFVEWEDANGVVCEYASDALVKLGKSVIEKVLPIPSDESAPLRLRAEAISVLGRLGDDRAIPVVEKCIKSKHSTIRLYAATALARLRGKGSVQLLTALIADENENVGVRSNAISALDKRYISAFIDPLIRIIEDAREEYQLRISACYALARVKHPRIEGLFYRILCDRDDDIFEVVCSEAASQESRRCYQQLREILKDKRQKESTRLSAAHALAIGGGHENINPILRMVNDKDNTERKLRLSLLDALARANDDCALNRLFSALREDVQTAQSAAGALLEVRCPRAVRQLICILEDQNEYPCPATRANACHALCRTKSADVVPALIAILQNKGSPNASRRLAIHSLCEIGDRKGTMAILGSLCDEDPDIRAAAAWGLGVLGDAMAVKSLEQALKDERDPKVRSEMKGAIASIGEFIPD